LKKDFSDAESPATAVDPSGTALGLRLTRTATPLAAEGQNRSSVPTLAAGAAAHKKKPSAFETGGKGAEDPKTGESPATIAPIAGACNGRI
jgi:hypothetical protein